MPNANYLRGRRYEYEVKKRWTSETHKALRTAGSHGAYDIIAYDVRELGKVETTREVRRGYEYISYITPLRGFGIQCKVKKIRITKKGSMHANKR